MFLLLFNITNIVIKSISISHPLNLDCRITNNPPCVVYVHLIGLRITGHFLKLGLFVINKVTNNEAIFEVRLPIKIQSTPRLELVNHSHWLYKVVDWRVLHESVRFTTVLRSIPPRFSYPCYPSAVWCLLLICNRNCVFSNVGVDQNCKLNFI